MPVDGYRKSRHLLLSKWRRDRTQSVIVKPRRETEVMLGFFFSFFGLVGDDGMERKWNVIHNCKTKCYKKV